MTQAKALAILKSGRNVFLTGSAGAGKTFVLNQYIDYLKTHKVPVAITASTGIAATHMNGMTIHSWAGIGIKTEISNSQLGNLWEKKYFRDKMDSVKVLVIDEISMLHRHQLNLVNKVLKYFKGSDQAFGGIQVIFSGDFFQLPPIGNDDETSREKFAFMSQAWVEAKPVVCYLSEQHRQSENDLNFILNEIRLGSVSQKSIDLLESRLEVFPDDGDKDTQLFTHNADVDRINAQFLEEIRGDAMVFPAQLKGNETLLEVLKKSVLASETLELKEGAHVMFLKNNYEAGYVNGTLGKVIDFAESGNPMVKTKNNGVIEAKPETWAIEDESGKPLASFVQVPLRLGWAITVHKSQGMTLDSAVMDLSRAFEKGQGYVALSRLRDLSGLTLKGLNQTALEVDPLALRADARFRELSAESDKVLEENKLSEEFEPFILHSGGTISKKEIAKQKEKLSQKTKEKKIPTADITKSYVLEKLTLDEIAEKRGMSRSTILTHILKIAESDPDVDLELYRPSEEVFVKVRAAMLNQEGEEKVSMNRIFSDLGGEVSYDDIKGVLVFLEFRGG